MKIGKDLLVAKFENLCFKPPCLADQNLVFPACRGRGVVNCTPYINEPIKTKHTGNIDQVMGLALGGVRGRQKAAIELCCKFLRQLSDFICSKDMNNFFKLLMIEKGNLAVAVYRVLRWQIARYCDIEGQGIDRLLDITIHARELKRIHIRVSPWQILGSYPDRRPQE